jgi:acetylornithine/succinyldiaminopimelate/putrescine aminotransferase
MNSRFFEIIAQTTPSPPALEIIDSEGVFLIDINGDKFIDCISGISVSYLGHRNNEIINAIKNQADKFLHVMVYGEHILKPQVEYAELLTSLLPTHLNCVYFTNSGAEATEGAMKLAKKITKRKKFISCINAYHGSTQGALSLAGSYELKKKFEPLIPYCTQINYGKFEDLKYLNEDVAALFIEPISAEAGIIEPPNGYLEEVRKICTEKGIILVFDEIQTGFGRTGKLWGFENSKMEPDVILLGKALGAGLPLGAFIAKKEWMDELNTDPILGHITTYGGNPLSCAAGLAGLKYLISNELLENVVTVGNYLKKELSENLDLKVYGKGFLLSAELNFFERVLECTEFCKKHGVLIDWFLFNDKRIRIAPPLIFTIEHADALISTLKKYLDSIKS